MKSTTLNEKLVSDYKREIFSGKALSYQAITERIDAIIHELEMLRSIVVTAHSEPTGCDLAGKLFGVLGKGTWEEYDSDIEWRRFDR